MPQKPSRRGFKNRVLAKLAVEDFNLLAPHLAPVDLPLRTALETSNKRIETIYFLDRGFASVVANGSGEKPIEVGMIGLEGMTGLPVVLGHDRAAYDTYIQAAGSGWAIGMANLRAAMDKSVQLHRSFLRCAHAFLLQTTQTALANGRNKNEERLARWLLMADDRIDGGELPSHINFLRTSPGSDAGATGPRAQRAHQGRTGIHRHPRPKRVGEIFQWCVPPTRLTTGVLWAGE